MGAHRRLEYEPSLDGVRALALTAVLLFHAGTPGFGGGYLGVSLFFTLSGFLITGLLLDEHYDTGRIAMRRFYVRRLRRLLPASTATVAAVVLIAAVTDVFDQVVGLRAQVVGSLLQVANWVLLAGDTSYQDLLAQASGTVSPLEHFWSLAIEQQFYWVWPPVIALLLTRVAAPRARLVVMAVVTGASMVAAPAIAQVWGPDAAYWATPARLGEILVGALLAFALHVVPVPRHASLLAPPALGVLAIFVVTFPSSSGPAYAGLLPLVAIVSGALILGMQAEGWGRRALSLAPLVALGKISYGTYLVHWPVYVIADAERTGLDGAVLTLLRLVITLAIAVASYLLIERPIRTHSARSFRFTSAATAMGTAALVAVALVVLPGEPTNYWAADAESVEAVAIDRADPSVDLTLPPPTASASATDPVEPPDAVETESASPTTATDATPPSSTAPPDTVPPPPPLPELARPVRIVVTGDSTGDALGTGIVGWAAANPDLAQVEVQAALGCGFLMGGERELGEEIVSTASCTGWPEAQLFPVVERTVPDVVAVMVSAWDLGNRRWDDGALLRPDDPAYRLRLFDTYLRLVDDLVAAGASRVAFIREPVPNVWWGGTVTEQNDPSRHAVLADVHAEVAAARPDRVRVIELAEWLSENGLDVDRDVRPDGVHLAPEAATAITSEFLGEQLLRAALV